MFTTCIYASSKIVHKVERLRLQSTSNLSGSHVTMDEVTARQLHITSITLAHHASRTVWMLQALPCSQKAVNTAAAMSPKGEQQTAGTASIVNWNRFLDVCGVCRELGC
jgi:hypothetical protein